MALLLAGSTGALAQSRAFPFEAGPDSLQVEVPAGGGCPNYSASSRTEGSKLVILLRNNGDTCKGWFPNETRIVSFSWQTLGLGKRPDRDIQVLESGPP